MSFRQDYDAWWNTQHPLEDIMQSSLSINELGGDATDPFPFPGEEEKGLTKYSQAGKTQCVRRKTKHVSSRTRVCKYRHGGFQHPAIIYPKNI